MSWGLFLGALDSCFWMCRAIRDGSRVVLGLVWLLFWVCLRGCLGQLQHSQLVVVGIPIRGCNTIFFQFKHPFYPVITWINGTYGVISRLFHKGTRYLGKVLNKFKDGKKIV